MPVGHAPFGAKPARCGIPPRPSGRSTLPVCNGGRTADIEENMKTIKQAYNINAPVDKVWKALVDPKVIDAWGGGPAKMAAKADTSFSLWDGDIHGNNLEGVEILHQRLDQLFKCHYLPTMPIAPVLGAHTGPGLVGFSFGPAALWG